MNQELPDVQAGFRKCRGTRDQMANICWVIEKARKLQKNIYFCGQEILRRNGVALIVNKRFQNAVLGCNLKNERMISVSKAKHSLSQ